MRTTEAVSWAGGVRRLAERLGLSVQAIYAWGDYPPMLRQYELEIISGGQLKAERKQ
jgi:hypothetical protein